MPALDLTPFGFTPTESHAYEALLEAGPSSGYAIGKILSIARANAYQALDGLVAKGGAAVVTPSPKTYRATAPNALLAAITVQETRHLEELEQVLTSVAAKGAPETIRVRGERQLLELALRSATRATGLVTCLAPEEILSRLTPLWRKRGADGLLTELWSIGAEPRDFPLPITGVVSPERLSELFPHPPVILLAPESAIVALQSDELYGMWTSAEPYLSLARAAMAGLRTTH